MRWDFTVGSDENGAPTMFIKHLFHFRGYRIDLHKMVRADAPECFHSHPARAIRVVLRGGYVEEIYSDADSLYAYPEQVAFIFRDKRVWKPFGIGRVEPDFVHRISRLLDGPSYSIWFRAPITHDIKLLGTGWKLNAEVHQSE